MKDTGEMKMPQVGLQTPEHEELLNLIDTLRAHGISQYIDLPQVIVCGDQSSGKSSVLEAISGLRFPTKDNLCTRFATELILRRGTTPNITVTIVPDAACSEEESQELSKFKSPSSSIDDFASIVKSAEKAMGLDNPTTVFSKHVLRVELCGPSQPNLTLVDLPGIFWAGDENQSDDDAAVVQAMVKSYMVKSRSIILAVVSAKSDLAMQIITRLAREIDPQGLRTLGIITKPDLLFAGSDSEAAFVKLAKNENIYFKLGWHVLKNRDYNTKDTTREERDAAETEFFSSRVWSSALSKTQLGINNLRPRLSRVLLGQILCELPSLVKDVENELKLCKDRLRALGDSRGTLAQQRTYMLNASQCFVELMKAAIGGAYVHVFFGNPETNVGYDKRLRAVVQATLSALAEQMRLQGHAQEIVTKEPAKKPDNQSGPQIITREAYLDSVSNLMCRSQGCELPGLFNPAIVGDLFFNQSRPWQHILHDTEEKLVLAAKIAVTLIVEHACDLATSDGIMRYIIRPNMESILSELHAKVEEILKPHMGGHPITLNHYFTDNLQKKREQTYRHAMSKKLEGFFGVDPESDKTMTRSHMPSFDIRDLLSALTAQTEVDMNRFACTEAINAMEAYYKVALKSIIDSFSIYAIEECLLRKLPNLFEPQIVFSLEDAVISQIAGESAESMAERQESNKKLKVLELTMTTLRRMKNFGSRDGDSVSDGTPRNAVPVDEKPLVSDLDDDSSFPSDEADY